MLLSSSTHMRLAALISHETIYCHPTTTKQVVAPLCCIYASSRLTALVIAATTTVGCHLLHIHTLTHEYSYSYTVAGMNGLGLCFGIVKCLPCVTSNAIMSRKFLCFQISQQN